MELRNESKILYVIVVLSITLSLLYSLIIRPPLNVDAKAHNRIAINLVQGNGYWENIPPDKEHDRAIGRSGPLLEFFTAGIYRVFGVNLWPVWIIQAILHGLTAFFVFKLAQIVFRNLIEDKRLRDVSSLLAAAVYGFYPDLIETSAMLMTETTFLFFFVLALYAFFLYFDKPKITRVVFFSFLFALAFFGRSTVVPIYLVFLVYFVLKRRFAHAFISVLIFVSLLSPWIIRNYITFGKFIPSRIFGFYTLYVGNHYGASGENDIEVLKDAKKIEEEQGVFAVDEYSKKKFFEFVKERPMEYITLHFKRLSIYFSFLRPTGFWPYLSYRARLIINILSGAFSVLIFIFGISGLIYWVKARKDKIYLLLGTILLTPLPFIFTVVETRYRYQIYPLLAVFAGFAISFLCLRASERYNFKNTAVFTLIILLANTFVDFYINFSRIVERLTK